jgi:hypothetical protein
VPAKAVYLISPGYRRWITPDFTEIVFETEGFDPKDGKSWQARLIVTDLDGGAEATSTFPIDLSRKTFTLPVPKFHRRAEIILFLENPRDREPVCEGRWKLTNIPKEELTGLSYFDSRGVFFHEGVGRFPIVAWSPPGLSPSKWSEAAEVGFSGLIVSSRDINDVTDAQARSLNMLLFARVATEGAEMAAIRNEVRRIQRHSSVAGYADSWDSPLIAAFRSADPSRPTIALATPFDLQGDEYPAKVDAFQDIVMVASPSNRNSVRMPSCCRTGNAMFGFGSSAADEQARNYIQAFKESVTRGAAGFVTPFDAMKSVSEFIAPMKAIAPVVNAVVRGVPEPSDDSTEDRWFWRRRLPNGERAVIEAKRGDPPTATFKFERGEK